MPIHRRENQYQGVNAHLHSFLQNEPGGWWETFHASHIAHLRDATEPLLPSGYYCFNEKSLQLTEALLPQTVEDTPRPTLIRPDVSIYGGSSSGGAAVAVTADAPTLTLTDEIEVDEEALNSVVIHQLEGSNLKPVTRIELLSPANKVGGSHYPRYLVKREETLLAGINLVEIDYLHQTRSIIGRLPIYPNAPDSYPYWIVVSDPHIEPPSAVLSVFGVRVDERLPKVWIPLSGKQGFVLDFGAVYNFTFAQNRYYGDIAVDYEQKPARFETYHPDDQQRIEARMAAVASVPQPASS